MEIKNLKGAVANFVPPSGFNQFFNEWKIEQKRLGLNWSVKSEDFFRESMITGMIFLSADKPKSQEAVQEETIKKEVAEEKRTRTRIKPETSDTIEPSNRTRTRTRTSN
jgi:hypothetical protein